MKRGTKGELIGKAQLPHHYSKGERVAWLAVQRSKARLYPERCCICYDPTQQYKTITLVDLIGGEGMDGELDCWICERCLTQCRKDTDRIIAAKAIPE